MRLLLSRPQLTAAALLCLLIARATTAALAEAESPTTSSEAEMLAEPARQTAVAAAIAASDAAPDSVQLEPLVINSSRISELDVQIRKLSKKIERAQKRLKKTSSLDQSINADDLPKLLALLGGHTSGQRKALASERLLLMEAERSILEALKHVRTRRDEQELKAQLHSIKSMGLLLEQS